MKHRSLARLAMAAFLAATGAVNYAHAIIVKTAPPPPPRGVTMPANRPPRHGMVWTPGYYRWHGGRYRWVGGRWVVPPRPGAVWIAPQWRHSYGGYGFAAGHWR